MMVIYQFTVSDALGLSLSAIEEIAIDGAAYQQTFEIQMGAPDWGENWGVELVGVEFSSSGRRFNFQVIQYNPHIREVTREEEFDHLREALDNLEAEVDTMHEVFRLRRAGFEWAAHRLHKEFYDGI